MEVLPFADVSSRQGVWQSLGRMAAVVNQGDNLTSPIDPKKHQTVRDFFARCPIVMELLSDFVAFDSFFLDAFALDHSSLQKGLAPVLGRLWELAHPVAIDFDVYRDAIDQVRAFDKKIKKKMKYLEEEYPEKAYGPAYFDANLKLTMDELRKHLGAIPSTFIDSQGTVERILLYSNVQRRSGAPARLSNAHLEALKDFKGALPLSTIEFIQKPNARDKIESDVKTEIPGMAELSVTPIFEMIIDRIASAHQPISIVDAVIDIRGDFEAQCFREYLWQVNLAIRLRDIPKLNLLKKTLVDQLRTFDELGTSRTRRTKRISITLVPGYVFEIPLTIKVPRPQDQDYVGFVGRWLGPHAI
ncbi:hypothetical protein [Rhizobium ruizarguesonis]|uniref:hypothetical protein n=1 Tax=Rhizobium ruizarguesonis TaxID=2081791 RepID=UPI00102F934E|nr:hypothetical protein [Rhizobium ruizarguesonis]TBA94434.1 hypothetical protein ELH52_31255 [Rhizobium ruizarguesonis]